MYACGHVGTLANVVVAAGAAHPLCFAMTNTCNAGDLCGQDAAQTHKAFRSTTGITPANSLHQRQASHEAMPKKETMQQPEYKLLSNTPCSSKQVTAHTRITGKTMQPSSCANRPFPAAGLSNLQQGTAAASPC
jgi:hypothetical protein